MIKSSAACILGTSAGALYCGHRCPVFPPALDLAVHPCISPTCSVGIVREMSVARVVFVSTLCLSLPSRMRWLCKEFFCSTFLLGNIYTEVSYELSELLLLIRGADGGSMKALPTKGVADLESARNCLTIAVVLDDI